ncbi:MAEA [Bugula neritina]|uniref:E3 ubiquitin-protein transferase MAEA n=1 Tax=Bugula neritina TaxID=10212 RepID=A0A7J7JFV1_BUGNE|nr:MAEA [Bugula neritina]KAF6029181.1 MAEA [Bugula neritina]
MADVQVLEHSTLKVPYESLNRKFRNAQKNIDKEISHVNSTAHLIQTTLDENASVYTVSQLLSSMVAKLKVLKRKASESIEEEAEAAKVCKRRLSHLQEYESLSFADEHLWKKKRLDRMLVEYCLRLGYYDTANLLSTHSGIKDLTNVEIFLHSKAIEDSLLNHHTELCLVWCHENKTKLRKSHSCLEIKLRQQDFVECVRKNMRLEAVKMAKTYFSKLGAEHMPRVRMLMALLAFPSDTKVSPYMELFAEERWTDLIDDFRKENFNLHQLTGNCAFLITLQCGLSALKTPQCYKSATKNDNCPVCSKQLNELAKGFPISHCSHSKLVCSISGDIISEHNPPLALPNGHVYGSKALENMALENDGKVICPRTSSVFALGQAEKVYLM